MLVMLETARIFDVEFLFKIFLIHLGRQLQRLRTCAVNIPNGIGDYFDFAEILLQQGYIAVLGMEFLLEDDAVGNAQRIVFIVEVPQAVTGTG